MSLRWCGGRASVWGSPYQRPEKTYAKIRGFQVGKSLGFDGFQDPSNRVRVRPVPLPQPRWWNVRSPNRCPLAPQRAMHRASKRRIGPARGVDHMEERDMALGIHCHPLFGTVMRSTLLCRCQEASGPATEHEVRYNWILIDWVVEWYTS